MVTIDLTDNEKLILDELKKHEVIELAVLKSKFELSNKAWDVAMKGLSKKSLSKVSKEGEQLLVKLL